jgi:hypothetical protein
MYKVKYYIIMSQMRYYKLDGQLEEPQKKISYLKGCFHSS